MKLCRDTSCDYCYGGIIHNHLLNDDGSEYDPLCPRALDAKEMVVPHDWYDAVLRGEFAAQYRRALVGRVVRWARATEAVGTTNSLGDRFYHTEAGDNRLPNGGVERALAQAESAREARDMALRMYGCPP